MYIYLSLNRNENRNAMEIRNLNQFNSNVPSKNNVSFYYSKNEQKQKKEYPNKPMYAKLFRLFYCDEM